MLTWKQIRKKQVFLEGEVGNMNKEIVDKHASLVINLDDSSFLLIVNNLRINFKTENIQLNLQTKFQFIK